MDSVPPELAGACVACGQMGTLFTRVVLGVGCAGLNVLVSAGQRVCQSCVGACSRIARVGRWALVGRGYARSGGDLLVMPCISLDVDTSVEQAHAACWHGALDWPCLSACCTVLLFCRRMALYARHIVTLPCILP